MYPINYDQLKTRHLSANSKNFGQLSAVSKTHSDPRKHLHLSLLRALVSELLKHIFL